uniref:Uncharacterized protein n=1 Tax=Branchiostoma floridae TaxID=7739 RepID=C3YNZ5_BRAFL|eukprot:XP_002601982.1 hypothetical protein BRAFLDRAFT_98932 [Branchiostoma floridae]
MTCHAINKLEKSPYANLDPVGVCATGRVLSVPELHHASGPVLVPGWGSSRSERNLQPVSVYCDRTLEMLCCLENCNPSDVIAYKPLSLTVSYPGVWNLAESPPGFPGIDWTNNITLMDSLSLKVNPDVFTVRGNYTIRVSNDNPLFFPWERHAEYRFQVFPNPIPRSLLGGNSTDIPPDVCSVIPPEGVSLVEKFCIVCEGQCLKFT